MATEPPAPLASCSAAPASQPCPGSGPLSGAEIRRLANVAAARLAEIPAQALVAVGRGRFLGAPPAAETGQAPAGGAELLPSLIALAEALGEAGALISRASAGILGQQRPSGELRKLRGIGAALNVVLHDAVGTLALIAAGIQQPDATPADAAPRRHATDQT